MSMTEQDIPKKKIVQNVWPIADAKANNMIYPLSNCT